MTCKEMKLKKMTWKEMKMKMKMNLKMTTTKLLVMIVIRMKNMSLLILKAIDDGTTVKGKHSKSRLRSTNSYISMSLPTNASAFVDLSIQPQMQQVNNDVPFEPLSLLGASTEQVENETSTHDSCRSQFFDLGASVDDTTSRSRGRGPGVGLQTPVNLFDKLRITLIGERYVILYYNEIVIFVKNFNISKFSFIFYKYFFLSKGS
ncbi:PREDICTED: uncharacterized protein LOC18612673 [Theobroma cacao]|uniref:Uncharacterized protein LOC18612673 n=1 Tax=Theobroma cacao TaxID=3641 RepID=A0AB32W0N9_THECC|nr:PREDICTED: uncharacterized protein LOC18612673 [Theobroma cacao]